MRKTFAKFLKSLKQFIQTVKGQKFLMTECFLTPSWRFLISNEFEKIRIQIRKKILGFTNMQEKLEREKYTYVGFGLV